MNERRKPPRGPLLTTVLLGAVWSLDSGYGNSQSFQLRNFARKRRQGPGTLASFLENLRA